MDVLMAVHAVLESAFTGLRSRLIRIWIEASVGEFAVW